MRPKAIEKAGADLADESTSPPVDSPQVERKPLHGIHRH
jgi:hypothetical protein